MFTTKFSNNNSKFEVSCYVCHGKGWVIPQYWMSVVPPKPHKCKTCCGRGIVEIVD